MDAARGGRQAQRAHVAAAERAARLGRWKEAAGAVGKGGASGSGGAAANLVDGVAEKFLSRPGQSAAASGSAARVAALEGAADRSAELLRLLRRASIAGEGWPGQEADDSSSSDDEFD